MLRGLHLQSPGAQGKLVSVLKGEVFDVVVDIRRDSPAFGRWFGTRLNDQKRQQLYLPPGVAHGFVVTGEDAMFHYKCTDYYQPSAELTLQWNDPDVGIDWPVAQPKLSPKDTSGIRLKDLPRDRLIPFSK